MFKAFWIYLCGVLLYCDIVKLVLWINIEIYFELQFYAVRYPHFINQLLPASSVN